MSRCMVLHVDESAEQTAKVHEMQRHKNSFDGYLEDKHLVPEIIKKHRIANKLLQKVNIFNPYLAYINFPTNRAVMRRAQQQFLTLIDCICVIRQMQKKDIERLDKFTNEKITVKECDLIDYELARGLFINGGLLQNDEDLPAGMIKLYEVIRRMVKKQAKKNNLNPEEITFIQKDIRTLTDLSGSSVKQYMRMLVEYEYLQVSGGKRHGTRFCYRLREDNPIEEIDTTTIIPTVDQIKEMMKQDKDNEKN